MDVLDTDDNFFALLGSDHGKGPARMLAAYPVMFGRRIIARARLFYRRNSLPDLCWFLEELARPEKVAAADNHSSVDNRPKSRKERRSDRRREMRSSNASSLNDKMEDRAATSSNSAKGQKRMATSVPIGSHKRRKLDLMDPRDFTARLCSRS